MSLMTAVPDNEFSDLDRTVFGPDGATFRLVASAGTQSSGRGLVLRRGGRVETVPVLHLVAVGEDGTEARLLLSEPATSRKDAVRIIDRLMKQVETGAFQG
jgi:hypothetical protein